MIKDYDTSPTEGTLWFTSAGNIEWAEMLKPDDFEDSVGDDKHFASHFTAAADHVARCEDGRPHLQDQVVQELGLALLKYRHLQVPPQKMI